MAGEIINEPVGETTEVELWLLPLLRLLLILPAGEDEDGPIALLAAVSSNEQEAGFSALALLVVFVVFMQVSAVCEDAGFGEAD